MNDVNCSNEILSSFCVDFDFILLSNVYDSDRVFKESCYSFYFVIVEQARPRYNTIDLCGDRHEQRTRVAGHACDGRRDRYVSIICSVSVSHMTSRPRFQ